MVGFLESLTVAPSFGVVLVTLMSLSLSLCLHPCHPWFPPPLSSIGDTRRRP